MLSRSVLVFCVLVQSSWTVDLNFPANFKFGAATSSYQIEGGWNEDGKGEHIWDRMIHMYPWKIADNKTGDVAADSYHKWRKDVAAAKELGLQFYRFSISWPRILPTGFINKINRPGVKYYSDLIDALLAEGIQPIITMYHWELPVKILDLGGWTNPLIAEWFGNYARTLFSFYADRVKTWVTINEPVMICDMSYNVGLFAPGIQERIYAPYLCNKHVLLAHAEAYRIYEKEFKSRYPGKISITNYEAWFEPLTPEDNELAILTRQFGTGRYSHPIYSKEGGWPPSIEKVMLDVSLKQGFNESRLPAFTKEEMDYVKGTSDFYSFNHYTTYAVRQAKPGEDSGYWIMSGSPELNAVLEVLPDHVEEKGPVPLFVINPEGIRHQISWIRENYGDIDIMIMENGISNYEHKIRDIKKIDYMKAYLEQVLLSIKVDNASVIGYTAWSLLDNFEWLEGYRSYFGMYYIDFKDPNLTRIPKASAHYYACVIKNRSLNVTDCFDESRIEERVEQNGGSMLQDGGLVYTTLFIFSLIFLC